MVYFIQAGEGPIKIGYTEDLARRLQELQVSQFESLRLLAAVPGTRRLEAVVQDHFDEHHLRGDWYAITRSQAADMVARLVRGELEAVEVGPGLTSEAEQQLIRLARTPTASGVDFMALEAAFDGRPKMFSEDLAAILGYDNAKQLSVALRPFSICPRTIRIGKELKRGYYAHDFVRIWAHLRTEPTAA